MFFYTHEIIFRRPNRSRASLQQSVPGVGGDARAGVYAGSHLGQGGLVRDVDRRDRRPLARDDDGRISDASRQRHTGYVRRRYRCRFHSSPATSKPSKQRSSFGVFAVVFSSRQKLPERYAPTPVGLIV